MERLFNIGDIVKHFKHIDDKINPLNYMYEIIGEAINTVDNNTYMIYKALYDDRKIYCRPIEEFYSEVDTLKYPNCTQKYRFEKI